MESVAPAFSVGMGSKGIGGVLIGMGGGGALTGVVLSPGCWDVTALYCFVKKPIPPGELEWVIEAPRVLMGGVEGEVLGERFDIRCRNLGVVAMVWIRIWIGTEDGKK